MLTENQIEQIARDKLTRSTLSALMKTDWKDGIDIDVLRTETIHFIRAIEAAVRAKYAPMRAFIADVMEVWPDGGIDGDELQEIAIAHGLLKLKLPNPTEPCSENCSCRDYVTPEEFAAGIECYERNYKDTP